MSVYFVACVEITMSQCCLRAALDYSYSWEFCRSLVPSLDQKKKINYFDVGKPKEAQRVRKNLHMQALFGTKKKLKKVTGEGGEKEALKNVLRWLQYKKGATI